MQRIKETLKNYFVPHEGNGYQPHALRTKAIAFVVVVVLVAEAAFLFGAKYIVPSSKLFGVIEVNALIDGTNQSRTANGLHALTVSPMLTAAAQEKANDMATKGYFAHTSPQGVTPWYWFENVGYNFSYAGENLAVNFSDSADVTNAWMNSPEHRANILSGDFTQIGMATAVGTFNGQPATYVVEEFGTPAAAPIAFVNTASAASVPTTAPQPVVVTPPASKTGVAKSKPIVTTAAKPKPVAVVPVIVAIQNAQTTSSAQTFVAVKGASAEAGAPAPVAQGNALQRLLADPKALANDVYYLLMFVFLLALVLNVFIKIRVQYPKLIAGGLLVVVAAGLCVMLNQSVGFLHVMVL